MNNYNYEPIPDPWWMCILGGVLMGILLALMVWVAI